MTMYSRVQDVPLCRICLAIDVKVQDVQVEPWNTYLENVLGVNLIAAMDLPPYACYECATLMKKTYSFREKCLLGQSVLHGILQTNGMIPPDLIRGLDRQSLNLASRLHQQAFTEESIINITHIDDHEEKLEIKDEPTDAHEEVKNGGFEDFSFGALSTDDDEPLSLHKSNNEKKSKYKKKIRKTKLKTEEDSISRVVEVEIDIPLQMSEELDEDLSPDPDQSQPDLAPARRKRGRPRKTPIEQSASVSERKRRTKNTGGVSDEDMNLEEYVTVVKLTEEEQLEEITNRQQSSNYLNAAFQCNLCYKGFIDSHAWRHHVGKHDPSAGDMECPICKFRFKDKRALQKHAVNHEKKYACKACSYVSKTATQAKQHQRWHKGVTYKCQHCDEVSTKWTSYLSHVRIKHPSEFICGVCGYSFVSKLGLTMHRTMMHKQQTEDTEASTEEGPYCNECDVKFISVEAYKRHMVMSAKHTKKDDFKPGCRVCGSSFDTAEQLRLHRRKEHARKRPKNYGKKPNNHTWPAACEHCSEIIPNAREHWTHFRRAHPDKSYPVQKNHVCDICGKTFRGNAFLVYHKRTHFEERAYKCEKCPKAFFNRTNLQMHEKTHSDNRPYPCDVCFKAFKCKGALDRHYRSHTGVKPYECEVCGKAFGQSNSRKLHMQTVHLKQPAPYLSRARQERRRPPPVPVTVAYTHAPPDPFILS